MDIYRISRITIALLLLCSLSFADTSSTYMLNENSYEYKACNGTYILVINGEKTYFVNGEIQEDTFLGKSAKDKYEEAKSKEVKEKSFADRLLDLETRVEKLENK